MEAIIQYFQTLEQHPVQRLVILVAGLLFFWIIEGQIPFINLNYKKNKVKHAGVNFTLTIIHLVIHTFLALIIIKLSDWCFTNQFGIIYWAGAGILGTIIISFLVLDFFGGWLVHFVQHKTTFLWRFHLIHHSDNNVDVTTGLRHHPVESLLRGIFFLIAIIVSGAPMYAVMIFQTLLVISTAFTHANINLPRWVNNSIGWLLVSPAMHKVHHHYKQPYTDSNYGAVLSIWDRLFGSYKKLDQSEITYGLDCYYENEEDENIWELLKHPFRKSTEK